MRSFFRGLSAFLVFFVAAQTAIGATLVINKDGPTALLTGMSGLHVEGSRYNVNFTNGSCDSLFVQCDEARFAFSAAGSAGAASTAINAALASTAFDNAPSQIRGCTTTTTDQCRLLIPYEVTGTAALLFVRLAAINANGANSGGSGTQDIALDTATQSGVAYAEFTLAPVPLPAAAPLFGSVALVAALCRRFSSR